MKSFVFSIAAVVCLAGSALTTSAQDAKSSDKSIVEVAAGNNGVCIGD